MYIANQKGLEIKGTLIDGTGYFRFTAKDLENQGQICVRPSNEGYTKTLGLQFQILSEFDLLQSQGLNAPLLRGYPFKGYLPKGGIMFYRINTFPFPSFKMFLNSHMNKGDPLFYFSFIENFPYLKITAEVIKQMGYKAMTTHDINDHFYFVDINSYEEPHINTNQLGSIVHCPETSTDGCEFDLTIGSIEDPKHLIKDMKMYQPKEPSETHIYYFNVIDTTLSSIKIYLYSFSGDGEIKVSKDQFFVSETGKYHSTGNREYYECINEAQPGQPNTLLGKYYVQVTSSFSSIYYSIHYSTFHSELMTEIDVGSGEVITESINRKESKKKFTFVNRLTTANVNYFANIIALNCDISISFSGKKYSDRRNTFIIKPSDDIYQSGRYTFEVTLNMIDTQSQDPEEDCLMYLSGDETAIDKEILLNEGISHSMTLSKDVNRIAYLYPLLYTHFNDKMAINFYKEDEGTVKLTYSINYDKKPKTVVIANSNKKLYLDNQLSEGCSYKNESSLCPVMIVVELFETIPGQTIDFTIGVASKNEIPFYLPKGYVKQDLVGFKKNQHNYYYTDIKHLESGEIVINFKRGNGLMVARMVSKAAIDEHPNWNKRVRLPKGSSADAENLPFDYFNKKIVFTEEHTKDCLASGCELYIGVYVYELLTYIAEYSIFIRHEDTVVALPENNVVFGSLSKILTNGNEGEEEVDYFSVHIHTDTDRILLSLIGELCFGYAKLRKDKPTKHNANWSFEGRKEMLEIKASNTPISSTSMIGKDITFAIGTRGLENIYSSFYSFKVISPMKNAPTIIEVSSSYNEMWNINSKNGLCYFIIPIDPSAQLSRICMNTLSDKVANSKLEIFSRYIKASDYDFLSPQDKSSKLPTEVSHDHSSASAFHSNYLCVELGYIQWSVDSYLLVTVKSKEKDRITFLSNYYKAPVNIYVKPNSKEMFIIRDLSRLIVYGRENYYIEIVRLENSAIVSTAQGENLIINKEQKSLAIVLNSEGEKSVSIRPEDPTKSFSCYIQYLIRPQENFDEIKFGRYNYITYSTPLFPMIYYMPVECEDDNIIVNFRLAVYEYADGENLGDDDFTVQGLVTDENFIIKRKKDSMVEPEISSSITEVFNQALKLGSLSFPSKIIKEHIADSKKYLYVAIKPKESNKHKYTHLTAQVIAMPNNSVDRSIILPVNQYFFPRTDGSAPTKVFLFKEDPLDEVMEIEFSFLDAPYKYSVNAIPDSENDLIDHTKNGTTFLSEKSAHGRNFIQINVVDNKKGIAFIVYKSSASAGTASSESALGNEFFAIRYQSDKTAPSHYVIKKDLSSWEANANETKFAVSFESISDATGKVPQADYYINYYSTTNLTQLNSIYMKQEPIAVDKIVKSKSSELKLETEKAPKGDFYYTVTAVAKIGNTDEILVYTPIGIFSPKPESRGHSNIYYIIGGIALALVIIGIEVFFYFKHFKAEKIAKTDYNKINEAGPVLQEEEK